jgi:hypothetical protein
LEALLGGAGDDLGEGVAVLVGRFEPLGITFSRLTGAMPAGSDEPAKGG